MALISVLILGCVIAFFVEQIAKIMVDLLLATLFGDRIVMCSVFGIIFMQQDGKWSVKRRKFMPICQCLHTLNREKQDPATFEKRSKTQGLIKTIMNLCIGVGVLVSCLPYWFHTPKGAVDMMFMGFSAFFLFMRLVSTGIYFYAIHQSEKSLGGYCSQITTKMNSGLSFRDIDMKPWKELNLQKVTDAEKILYDSIYILYLTAMDRMDEWEEPTKEMWYLTENTPFVVQFTAAYYWLIFYYTVVDIKPQLAEPFMEKVETILRTDEDANAKRTLSAYYYGALKNKETAMEYYEKSVMRMIRMEVLAEREVEEKLLAYLKKKLDA